MCTQMHALDQSLGIFLDRIDRLHVPYMVVLTADHGAVDAPERLQEAGFPAQRVNGGRLLSDLNTHLKQALGIDWDAIRAEDVQQLYILPPGDPQFLSRVRSEAVSWLRQQPGVEAVFTRDQVAAAAPLPGKPASQLSVLERYHEGYDAERSPDLFVEFKRFATLGWPSGPSDSVAGHGSPWNYDRQVPILFWWPGAVPTLSPDAAETVDIAPTLASILGIAAPPVDGRCLSQVTACGRDARPTAGERGQ